MTFLKSAGLCLASDIFASLGNSATAATRRWVATSTTVSLTAEHRTPALKSLLDIGLMIKLLESRHPDPQATLTGHVTTRLHIKNAGGFTEGRQNFSSFIWHSCLYIAGGRKSERGPYYRDIWTLDLNKLDAWRQLPDYPVPAPATGLFLGWNMVLYNNVALLFTGRPTIDVSDLKTETWSSFHATYTPTSADTATGVLHSWPYPGYKSFDSAMQIIGDKMYVFGGGHGSTLMGCNLFMELDLSTRKWRRLSGTVRVTEHGNYSCPGPRKSPASWVSEDRTRIYILFGIFDREEAHRYSELHGETVPFGCSDFWSWSVKEENEKLQKTIIFGGYCPNLQSYVRLPGGQEGEFPYSYVADTFLFDMVPRYTAATAALNATPNANLNAAKFEFEPTRTAPKWKQVLTPGFPTYRCQAHLACDSTTGRTYMFGGWTNSQYIPTRSKLMAKTFGDVWELRVDVPGGHFEEVDVEEEARVARAGPWQRCFVCGAAGTLEKVWWYVRS
ncbi:hypothetical protein B0H14DRAFT_3871395 [Mycena olivaceomarginata]|nr:hypothetical protein B0H14DRAFT_3871395 [Mycena olivaceomarginata]